MQSTPGDVVAGVHPAVAVTHPAVIADTVFPENVYVFFNSKKGCLTKSYKDDFKYF